jgi:hypothetical protein
LSFLKSARQKAVEFEKRRRAGQVAGAKKRVKRQKEDKLIRKSHDPFGVKIKKKKQNKTLSHKSRIRLI